jgi:hypothetical protein
MDIEDGKTMTTTRRKAMGALLGLGAGTALYSSTLDPAAWRAYEAVEEAWIRDRHALLLAQCPDCADAADLDLELKLAELQRRALQFEYLSKHNPRQLRGGMWQLAWIPLKDAELARLATTMPAYRKQDEKVRRLTETLRHHEQYDEFHRAQTRLWKTPEYRSVHRRYSGRLQELNRIYGETAAESL